MEAQKISLKIFHLLHFCIFLDYKFSLFSLSNSEGSIDNKCFLGRALITNEYFTLFSKEKYMVQFIKVF